MQGNDLLSEWVGKEYDPPFLGLMTFALGLLAAAIIAMAVKIPGMPLDFSFVVFTPATVSFVFVVVTNCLLAHKARRWNTMPLVLIISGTGLIFLPLDAVIALFLFDHMGDLWRSWATIAWFDVTLTGFAFVVWGILPYMLPYTTRRELESAPQPAAACS